MQFVLALPTERLYILPVRYGWNPAKSASNTLKHGVAFDAVEGFDWETALVRASIREAGGEVRLMALGAIGDRLYALVFTIRTNTVWIISLRKASKREVQDYASEG